jgi:hypothetical protein
MTTLFLVQSGISKQAIKDLLISNKTVTCSIGHPNSPEKRGGILPQNTIKVPSAVILGWNDQPLEETLRIIALSGYKNICVVRTGTVLDGYLYGDGTGEVGVSPGAFSFESCANYISEVGFLGFLVFEICKASKKNWWTLDFGQLFGDKESMDNKIWQANALFTNLGIEKQEEDADNIRTALDKNRAFLMDLPKSDNERIKQYFQSALGHIKFY